MKSYVPVIMFQGKRDDVSAETGFCYAGSYLGTKRVLSFGVSYDFQDGYHHSSGDGILDLPLGPGVLTAQADVSHWNGGTWVDLPRQSAFMSEVGYLFDAANLSPIFRFERRRRSTRESYRTPLSMITTRPSSKPSFTFSRRLYHEPITR